MNIVRSTMLLVALSCLVMFVWAADINPRDIEYQVKAAYLYKFATYVEWPSSTFARADAPLIVGVLGADEVAAELISLGNGLQVNNRVVKVKPLKQGDTLTDVQILFIGRHESGHLQSLLDKIQSKPVLTVTESIGALEVGSVINFISVNDRIRFEISIASAERSNLKINARLLSVAQKIEPGRP